MIENLFADFSAFLPKILMGLGFIIVTIILYKLIIWFIKRLLKLSKIEKLNDFVNENELVANSNIKIDISNVIVGIAKFILILVILIIGAEILELSIVSVQIGKLLEYLPQFITGLLIFVFGVYMASQAKKLVHNMIKSLDAGGAKAISTIVFYLILVFVSITALNQIGVDTEIISNNLSYFIGAALIAMTIAVGLGSRDIVYRLILGFYTKKNLEIGMKIQIDDTVGRIISIDNICLVLQTDTDKKMFPIKKINNTTVKIFNES
ncbi:MAG: small-conductance mechanosensitive channel [Weeksellaceae bacterium]